jgi:fatty-acyl-CoA synthase
MGLAVSSCLLNESAEVSFVSSTAGLVWDHARLSDLAKDYLRLASAFAEAWRDDQIALLALDNCPELLICIWACLSAGVPFCIINPNKASAFLASELSEILPPAVVVCERVRCKELGIYCINTHASDELTALAADHSPIKPRVCSREQIAYFQLTSGSSGAAKAVPVTHEMLRINLNELAERSELSNCDRLVLWLPLYHDMGLVIFLAYVCYGANVLLLETTCFVRNPMAWLTHATDFRATMSAVPSFALRVTARLGRARRSALNLESLRFIWIGGEPVFARTLADFAAAFMPHGLKETALRPAYGLAESVVGVSTTKLCEPVPVIQTELHSLELGTKVVLARSQDAGNRKTISYVSNGKPLQSVEIQIWGDGSNSYLPELRVGRIMLRGPTICSAYAGQASDLEDGWRDTGDVGFINDGNLFIVGRRKDIIIRGGVNFAAEELEDAVHSAAGEAVRRVAAFSTIDHRVNAERIFVVCETRKPENSIRELVSNTLIASLGIAPDYVLTVSPGTIPLTTNGKIRRQELRERYAECDALATVPI